MSRAPRSEAFAVGAARGAVGSEVRLPGRQRPVDLRGTDPVADRLLPNLMIAGVSHAGATEFARALARHPEIKRPVVKRIDRYDPMRYDRPVESSLADYNRFFSNWTGQRYRLERSPTYFDGGRELVEAVARDLPELKVMMLLRDPAERLWVGYREKIATGRLPGAMTYEAYVERCLALRANGAERFEGNRYFRTLSCGLYAEHLGDWLELFDKQLLVVFAEDLDRSPRTVLDGVHRWLDLEPVAVGAAKGQPRNPVRRATSSDTSGLQTFDSPPERGNWAALPVIPDLPSLMRASAAAGRDLARRLPRSPVRLASRRPKSRADALYRRANRELADQLRSAGYRQLPSWLTR